MFVDVHQPWRHVKVTDHRAATDFAQCMQELCDVHCPEAEKLRVVLDDSAGVNYGIFNLAFVDSRIKATTWQIDQVIRYLKEHGVKRVLIASGSDEARSDPLCRGGDGLVSDKVPQDLARYLSGTA